MALPKPQRDLRNDNTVDVVSISTVPQTYKPSDLFCFEPLPTITREELSNVFNVVNRGNPPYEVAKIFQEIMITLHHTIYESLPPDTQKHFKRKKIV